MLPQNPNNFLPQISYVCYSESRKSKAERVVETSAVSLYPIEKVASYMQERIQQIDKTRKELREKYPNLLPA